MSSSPFRILIFLLLVLQWTIYVSSSKMSFRFQFNETQERLDNFGNPSEVPSGHAAQTPSFRLMSVHYIELIKDDLTPLGQGAVAYWGPQTNQGGSDAVDFSQAIITDNSSIFLTVNLKSISNLTAGTYTYIRTSVAYQNYQVKYDLHSVPYYGDLLDQSGTVASFVAFDTYITSVTPESLTMQVNANKLQGFWVFETDLQSPLDAYNVLISGQAPAGATTVVNPLYNTSPIPSGSCVVTGLLDPPLVISDPQIQDINILLSYSINKSFEWIDDGNGKWDISTSGQAEEVVDMGLRGLVAKTSFQDPSDSSANEKIVGLMSFIFVLLLMW